MWHEYIQPRSIDDVLTTLGDKRESARIVAGATDLLLELERGVRKGIETLVDITRLPGLDTIRRDDRGRIHLGPLVTHNDCAASTIIREEAYPLARAAWEVGAPQIRNRGTVAGNVITASPANDTITPLIALGAFVTLRSKQQERAVPLLDFYTGVRTNCMQPDEMLVDIFFPAMRKDQRGIFVKMALRRAQAISLVNVAVVLTLRNGVVDAAAIALGAVAPTIIRVPTAEAFLLGKQLSDSMIEQAAELTMLASRPIDDIRGSAAYRREMVRIITVRALRSIRDNTERQGFPEEPVLLRTNMPGVIPLGEAMSVTHAAGVPIETTINGKKHVFKSGHGKTLLRLLREEAGLIGTKEGCAEGECGACTVFLDGEAVMSCLVPAPRAHGAEIVTIEGLARNGNLHPVQQAFVDQGAVQCGYCTPGFIMAGAKLLEEKPRPSKSDVAQALTGNLCRCTGYYKIVRAVEDASLVQA